MLGKILGSLPFTRVIRQRMGISLLCFIFLSTYAIANESRILINGAGATFPFPLYSKWLSEYQKIHPEVEINYQSIGSGGGVRQLIEKTVDFGATDIPMTDQQLAKSSEPILSFPMVLGAVVLTYHLPGVPTGLKLSPEAIAGIFLGKIIHWDDLKLKTLNPTLTLPTLPITVVRRSDGSGTSAIFTDYLSKISSEWKQKVGSGTSVNWPVGLGGKGNEGVSSLIRQAPGTIGYTELIYAIQTHLSYAAIQNQSGSFILPDLGSVTAAAESASKQIKDDFRVSLTDLGGKKTYPITAFTYLLVYKTMANPKGKEIQRFLHWAVTQGQQFAENLFYAPLPVSFIKRVQQKIDQMKFSPQ